MSTYGNPHAPRSGVSEQKSAARDRTKEEARALESHPDSTAPKKPPSPESLPATPEGGIEEKRGGIFLALLAWLIGVPGLIALILLFI